MNAVKITQEQAEAILQLKLGEEMTGNGKGIDLIPNHTLMAHGFEPADGEEFDEYYSEVLPEDLENVVDGTYYDFELWEKSPSNNKTVTVDGEVFEIGL